MSTQLRDDIEVAKESAGHQAYLSVRERVLEMLEERSRGKAQPSDYWKQELAGFNHMFDASPLLIQTLREHCYHLTGIRPYEYRRHHDFQKRQFAQKLQALRDIDQAQLFVPESTELGGFGHEIDGDLVNLDTLKFYEVLLGLDRANFLEKAGKQSPDRRVILEIGAGWGGFAYQFKTLFPESTFVILDLPETLLFSATYLRTLFPNARTFLHGDASFSSLRRNITQYDFVFLPDYCLRNLELARLDLAINMVSFQEMTTEQVSRYIAKTADLGCLSFYSLNRERSPYNPELTTVSSILAEYYEVTEVQVLPVPYTQLAMPVPERSLFGRISKVLRHPRKVLQAARRRSMTRGVPLLEALSSYRHLMGSRKG